MPLVKYSKNKTTQYYQCRDCNRERRNEYYHTEAGKKAAYEHNKKMYWKYPDKVMARGKLYYALKTNKIVRPLECEACGAEGRIEGHHDDYTKPLQVKWLCTPCHRKHDSITMIKS